MTRKTKLSILFAIGAIICSNATNIHFRVNQLGYLENDFKVAVAMMPKFIENISSDKFHITNLSSGEKYAIDSIKVTQAWEPMEMCARIYFSSITTPGEYKLEGYNFSVFIFLSKLIFEFVFSTYSKGVVLKYSLVLFTLIVLFSKNN